MTLLLLTNVFASPKRIAYVGQSVNPLWVQLSVSVVVPQISTNPSIPHSLSSFCVTQTDSSSQNSAIIFNTHFCSAVSYRVCHQAVLRKTTYLRRSRGRDSCLWKVDYLDTSGFGISLECVLKVKLNPSSNQFNFCFGLHVVIILAREENAFLIVYFFIDCPSCQISNRV